MAINLVLPTPAVEFIPLRGYVDYISRLLPTQIEFCTSRETPDVIQLSWRQAELIIDNAPEPMYPELVRRAETAKKHISDIFLPEEFEQFKYRRIDGALLRDITAFAQTVDCLRKDNSYVSYVEFMRHVFGVAEAPIHLKWGPFPILRRR